MLENNITYNGEPDGRDDAAVETSIWVDPIKSKAAQMFATARGSHAWEHTQRTKYYDRFDPRARYTYEAITSSPAMTMPKPDK